MKLLALLACQFFALTLAAQTYSFDGNDKSAIRITPTTLFTAETGYGYDLVRLAPPETGKPFFFSKSVPDGNYRVTITLGSKKRAAQTTVRAESRRLFVENCSTRKGELRTFTFIVNKRNTLIGDNDRVKIKDREKTKLNWDDRLTIEVGGEQPACSSITIEPAGPLTTLWLCGNSTVVDQDYEPWASWGQMIPRWFDSSIAVANYAESGETLTSFLAANRWKKIMSLAQKGDYVFIEFGHNDQKERTAGSGAWYNFSTNLKRMVDEARQKGVTPIFVTPTQRRNFSADGHIQETHGDYPDAMRAVAQRENVQVIEVHDMTRTLFETLGVEDSKQTLVHYPANTFPNQPDPLADNTHFSNYGAYEISKMVVQGMKGLGLPMISHLRTDWKDYDPAHPDDFTHFTLPRTPLYGLEKPAGN